MTITEPPAKNEKVQCLRLILFLNGLKNSQAGKSLFFIAFIVYIVAPKQILFIADLENVLVSKPSKSQKSDLKLI